VGGLLCTNPTSYAEGNAPTPGPPGWAVQGLRVAGVAVWPSQKLDATYQVSRHLNPCYLQGDFDGDCRTDIAVLVKRSSDQKVGIAVLLRKSDRVHFLGAGTSLGNGGNDFRWMDMWQVYAKGPVSIGVGETASIQLNGDALLVEKSESASGIIYYDGSAFHWYQQGD
jgi:hypothetical protein